MFVKIDGVKCSLGKEVNTNEEKSLFQIFCITPIITMRDENKLQQIYEVFDDNYFKQIISDTENEEKVVDTHRIKMMSFGVKKPGLQFKGKYHVNLTDDDVSRGLSYLYKKGLKRLGNLIKKSL